MPTIRVVKVANPDELSADGYRKIASSICRDVTAIQDFEGRTNRGKANRIAKLAKKVNAKALIFDVSSTEVEVAGANTKILAERDSTDTHRRVTVPLPPTGIPDWSYLEDYINLILKKLYDDKALDFGKVPGAQAPEVIDVKAEKAYQMLFGMMMVTRCR